ncbi:hypothetical protein LCGC14_0912460 [marine sediment metagenome]|uniref:Uncharacterized protein n=1 Tax=marine sediment metagenome TaxID=412755 RepID=A0A0F9PDY5_9ZZZZ
MQIKMKTTILVLMILMIGLVSAVTLEVSLSTENKEVLKKVGKGIGNIEKTRQLYDENGTNYLNETYIDELKLIKLSNNEFKLYQEGGINKEFKVELEKICAKEGMCIEFEEEYECCLEWRAETDAEVLEKAEIKSKSILNKIASITLDREARSKQRRFEDVEITI